VDDVREVTKRVLDLKVPDDPIAAELGSIRVAVLRVACELRDLRDTIPGTVPRAYRVTLRGEPFVAGRVSSSPMITKTFDVVAYTRGEAMAQVHSGLDEPTGQWGEWMTRPSIVSVDPAPPNPETT
jgi:hypothetical protein